MMGVVQEPINPILEENGNEMMGDGEMNNGDDQINQQ